MRLRLIFAAAAVFIPLMTYSSAQNRSGVSVQPRQLESMRNMGLDTAKSGFPVTVPREWGRLVSVQKTDVADYAMFFENDAGEIYIVNLIQRGKYFYLNTYDNGGVALVIKR